MDELKRTLKRIAFYYLLLVISIIPCANIIPDSFPTRNLSEVYLLTLSVCLILYYSHRVSPAGALSVMMKSLSWMALLLILLRGIKYSAFAEIGVLARHTWYLYYVPMLLLPLFLFYIALFIAPEKRLRFHAGRFSVLVISLVFIGFILTNDLHSLVFRFKPGFADWDSEYAYGRLFYIIVFWQYALYLAAIAILVIKCRISSARKNAWLFLIPFTVGAVLIALLVTDKMPRLNGSHIIEFPEALIFTVAVVLECCIQLGLIPTNTDYGKLFRKFSISAQITDKKGNSVYSSYSAVPLAASQFSAESGARIDEHTVLHKMEIPGGFGFWQDDMTELDRLNAELADAKEELAQESELIRLRGELKEKQTKTEKRTLVYDAIAKRTQSQSQAISRLAETARLSDDATFKEECRGRILLLGAYIKRYANLMLISDESNSIEVGELALSVSEVLRYLNFCKIPGEFFSSADCTVNADAALGVFEAFETLLESNFRTLRGAFVNLSDGDGVTFKLTLENLTEPMPTDIKKRLSALGVRYESDREDDVTYVCFTMKRGGGAV